MIHLLSKTKNCRENSIFQRVQKLSDQASFKPVFCSFRPLSSLFLSVGISKVNSKPQFVKFRLNRLNYRFSAKCKLFPIRFRFSFPASHTPLCLYQSVSADCLRDCSWMTEEDFAKCFGACDISNLSVLQLDLSCRCISDYVLPATLARTPKSMSALCILSLRGASQLTDTGLRSLVSAAHALRSINLSQCSLLTSAGTSDIAQALRSHLLELYIDDYQRVDANAILPALNEIEHLEVLSLDGIESVSDYFVQELVSVHGHNMKELVLANCTDEAIAALVENSGALLEELSLNNASKVGNKTALALANRSKNLVKLDLSWCWNLTEEAVGLIVDSCLSLKLLKLLGCRQITNVLLEGHSNAAVKIAGVQLAPTLKHVSVPSIDGHPLRYSSPENFLGASMLI